MARLERDCQVINLPVSGVAIHPFWVSQVQFAGLVGQNWVISLFALLYSGSKVAKVCSLPSRESFLIQN